LHANPSFGIFYFSRISHFVLPSLVLIYFILPKILFSFKKSGKESARLSSPISSTLQHILPYQPNTVDGIFHNHLAQRQLPEVGLFHTFLQLAAKCRFVRDLLPRLQNRHWFGSTKGVLNKPYFFKGGFAIVVWL